jgi:hypothetical protein
MNRSPFTLGDASSGKTHVTNHEGTLKQVVTPVRLRELLDEHNVETRRPDFFIDEDEWEVAPDPRADSARG